MILNCAIVDNESATTNQLADYVKRIPFLHLTGTYNNTVDAMELLHKQSVDLVFLNVEMPEMNGIEFAQILPKKTKIIFISDKDKYAIESYKVQATNYLLKPISFQTLLDASKMVVDNDYDKKTPIAKDRFFFVKSDYKLIKLSFDDILYINGLKDYVKVYLKNGTTVTSLMNMKKMDELLPHPEFLRIHRSYIANMPKIDAVDRFRLVYGKEFIPISESYKDAVTDYLEDHTIS